MESSFTPKNSFRRGVVEATPIVIGYLPVAISFGILGTKMGLPVWATIGMSTIVFAGASQFVALQLLTNGVGILPIALATFVINLRHFLMGMSLGSHLPRIKKRHLLYAAQSMTDETYGINIAKKELGLANMLGVSSTAHFAWSLGTAIGALAGNFIPLDMKYFSGALPVMFVTLLTLQIKTKEDFSLTMLAMFLTLVLMFFLPGKWPFLISALLIPTLALCFKKRTNHVRQ